MILNDKDIIKAIEEGQIEVSGWEGDPYIGPSSLDLHLDNRALIIAAPVDGEKYRPAMLGEDMSHFFTELMGWTSLIIRPGDFMLLSTVEKIKFPDNIAGFVQGRSSIARAGIQVHAAGFVDPGFEGTITLEVTNMTSVPLVIPAGIRICQMVFARSSKNSGTPYSKKIDAKYQGQSGPVASKIALDL